MILSYQRYILCTWLNHCWCWPWSLEWSSVRQVFTMYSDSFFFPSTYCPLWKKVSMHKQDIWSGELRSTPLRMEYLYDIWDSSAWEIYMYICMYVYHYKLMDMYFILCIIIIWYSFIYFSCSKFSVFGHREPFQLVLVFFCFDEPSRLWFFVCFTYFLILQYGLGSSS